MRFEVFIDVKGDWRLLGHWEIRSIAGCNPYDLANAFLDVVANALDTPARWVQGQDSSVAYAYPDKKPGYVCAHCGNTARLALEVLDNGTTLACNKCRRTTVVDLYTPGERRWIAETCQYAERGSK